MSPTGAAGADLLVVGGGLLGLEAADCLARQGLKVTVVHPLGWPMERQLDATAGGLLTGWLRRGGIGFAMPASTAAIEGEVDFGLDDIDRLDEQSMLVVNRLRSRPSVKIVAVLRDDAPPTTAVTDLLRDHTIPVMTVPPLTADETAEFLRGGLRGRVSAPLAARLWALTRGNPLYLIALCEANVEQGAIARRGDVWVIDSELRVPDSLSTTIEAQLAGASDSVLEVVDSVALAEPLALSVLEQLCALDHIEDAETAGYIVIDDTDPFDGDPHARERPMAETIASLGALGVRTGRWDVGPLR